MPVLPALPEGFLAQPYVDEQGRVAVSVFVDHVQIGHHAFSQTIPEMRAERAEIARQAMPAALAVTPGEPPPDDAGDAAIDDDWFGSPAFRLGLQP